MKRSCFASSCLLGYFVFVLSVRPDAMTISDDPISESTNRVQENSNFFSLETVNFGSAHQQEAGDRPSFSSIGLSPGWMDGMVLKRRNELAREHAARAEECVKNNRLDEAVQEIDLALLRDPENIGMIGQAGLIYAAARQYEQASAMLRLFLQNYPEQVNHMAAWGGVLIYLDDLEDAGVMLRRALKLDPENVMARYQMETLALRTGQDSGSGDFWRLLDAVRFRMALGWLLNDQTNLTEVIGADSFGVLCDRIVGKGTAGKLDEIRVLLDQYADNERSADRKIEMTIDLCSQLAQLGLQNQSIVMAQAQACYDAARLDEAWVIIRKVQEQYPDYQMAWFNGGLIALQSANYEVAEMMFRKALALRQDGVSYFALACAYASMGKIDEAWTILKQLKKTEPENLGHWLEGDSVYLKAIKENARYAEIGP